MAKCSSCGRDIGFSFGKRLCRWCVEHERAQRGQDAEYQRVMPTPWKRTDVSNISFNMLFLGINLLVFAAMVMSGLSIMGPAPSQMIRWGGNYAPLTLGGEPWRLITYIAFSDEAKAIAFERYLKTASGRAFAKKRLR